MAFVAGHGMTGVSTGFPVYCAGQSKFTRMLVFPEQWRVLGTSVLILCCMPDSDVRHSHFSPPSCVVAIPSIS